MDEFCAVTTIDEVHERFHALVNTNEALASLTVNDNAGTAEVPYGTVTVYTYVPELNAGDMEPEAVESADNEESVLGGATAKMIVYAMVFDPFCAVVLTTVLHGRLPAGTTTQAAKLSVVVNVTVGTTVVPYGRVTL
jgi:hypothetical protein